MHFSIAGIRTVRLNERSIPITHYQLAASLLDPLTTRVPPAEVSGLYSNYGAIFVFYLVVVHLYFCTTPGAGAEGQLVQ